MEEGRQPERRQQVEAEYPAAVMDLLVVHLARVVTELEGAAPCRVADEADEFLVAVLAGKHGEWIRDVASLALAEEISEATLTNCAWGYWA